MVGFLHTLTTFGFFIIFSFTPFIVFSDTDKDLNVELLVVLEIGEMHPYAVKELIEEGVDPAEVRNQYGENPLTVLMNRAHLVEGKESFKAT